MFFSFPLLLSLSLSVCLRARVRVCVCMRRGPILLARIYRSLLFPSKTSRFPPRETDFQGGTVKPANVTVQTANATRGRITALSPQLHGVVLRTTFPVGNCCGNTMADGITSLSENAVDNLIPDRQTGVYQRMKFTLEIQLWRVH